jgi:hypothetical protein
MMGGGGPCCLPTSPAPTLYASCYTRSMRDEAFALTSLQDWTFGSTAAFFFTDELVLCSFDVLQALRMVFEPSLRSADVSAWCAATRAKAARVLVIPDREIASVRVTLRMTQHQLFVARERGGVSPAGYRTVRRPAPAVYRYSLLLEREQVGAVARRLGGRVGARFELATTRAYAFAHHLAPWLTR